MIPGIVASQFPALAVPLDVSGVYSNTFTSTASVPSGAEVGDLLILTVTAGSIAEKTVPVGFTSVYAGVSGAIGVRTMQVGDKNFSLGFSGYVTVVAVRRATGSPTIDAVSSPAEYTTNQTFQTQTATPTEPGDLAVMIFMSASNAMKAPQPGYNNLITYNRSGAGGCGMAVSYTMLETSAAFAGTSCGGSAASIFPATALTILLK